jgi:hypothetical protein
VLLLQEDCSAYCYKAIIAAVVYGVLRHESYVRAYDRHLWCVLPLYIHVHVDTFYGAQAEKLYATRPDLYRYTY